MASLTGSSQPVQLGEGYAIRAAGVTGTATLQRPTTTEARSRSRGAADGTPALEEALRATNVVETREIDLALTTVPPSPTAARARSGADLAPTLELQVPDLGPDAGQLVLSSDEAGALRWHLPLGDDGRIQPPSTRGSGKVKRFVIPAARPAAPTDGAAASRGLTSLIGRKLLKVLVYPIVDPLIGKISDAFAERWEERNRQYGLRTFPTNAFRNAPGAALGGTEWSHLKSGRALLYIHGTFSTAHGAFSLLDDPTFQQLSDLYQGRVFAFNHFSLSHDPQENITWMLQQVREAGAQLDLDIICHSRGGLVARTLAEKPSVFGLETSAVTVRRTIFVGVPNSGTLLAHPDHMVSMIDRWTSSLNLFPSGAITETLESLITAVKVIGHGALNGLGGLASMRPDGQFLTTLNSGSPDGSGYRAIAANYEPTDQGLKYLLSSGLDGIADSVFEDAGNDLVVPEAGVYGKNGSSAFPITPGNILQVGQDAGRIHTTLFGHPAAREKIVEWLRSPVT